MADSRFSDYFISDTDDGLESESDELVSAGLVMPTGPRRDPADLEQEPAGLSAAPLPSVVPFSGDAPALPKTARPSEPERRQDTGQPAAAGPPAPSPAVAVRSAAPGQDPASPSAGPAQQPTAEPRPSQVAAAPLARPAADVAPSTAPPAQSREQQLVSALDRLMQGTQDVQAAALVSLDGFTMASALPPGMQEDRVGAMSAAILGLGERAAAELGRGHLSQVFIEGADGYVLLMSAGDRAVLTVLADRTAKLGLVLYDMRSAAAGMGRILG